MDHLTSMRTFMKVAECLNFAAAARHLDVSNAVVTRQVAMLESHLNAKLLNRTTRSVSLTAAGRAYLQGCVEWLNELESMEKGILSAADESADALKIACAASFAEGDLADLLTEFHLAEPQIRFDLSVFESMQRVTLVDFDVCFSVESQLRDSAMICRSLAVTRDVIVASPRYVEQCGIPERPDDLTHHSVLVAGEIPARFWEFDDAHGVNRALFRPVLRAGSVLAVKRAALAGLGIARLAESLVRTELNDRTLVPVLGQFPLKGNERAIWMLYPAHRHIPRTLQSFTDFVVSRSRRY
ncbi:bacterial regulatory helix-turn-helix, lysR family protein [Paraburkholderia fungorum]|jgi:DNA-binding transcriptional LysR family regulator|uniref:Bacterial regulatory helix-turn-helix, lysR family protein n=1 Tax=Paraburkholderia fungorum TaxID=134537 RepID=A0AAP5QJM4_9BURK|nr:LysR family transcriptional regulator [Paraburkholderia fungorum]AJZ56639.1 bacterial regulatory helix-turn-helix, lysR family protein [Paraburkholderia fungorum]MDT8843442.1 LysR family transcriptional regulator [Paraburkholderia fungorum]